MNSNYVLSVFSIGAIILAFVVGVEPSPVLQSSAEGIGLGSILNTLSNIAAPLLGGVIGIIIWFHKRLKSMEENQQRIATSLYGTDRDSLNAGVIEEVRSTRQEVTKLEQLLSDVKDTLEEDDD